MGPSLCIAHAFPIGTSMPFKKSGRQRRAKRDANTVANLALECALPSPLVASLLIKLLLKHLLFSCNQLPVRYNELTSYRKVGGSVCGSLREGLCACSLLIRPSRQHCLLFRPFHRREREQCLRRSKPRRRGEGCPPMQSACRG